MILNDDIDDDYEPSDQGISPFSHYYSCLEEISHFSYINIKRWKSMPRIWESR